MKKQKQKKNSRKEIVIYEREIKGINEKFEKTDEEKVLHKKLFVEMISKTLFFIKKYSIVKDKNGKIIKKLYDSMLINKRQLEKIKKAIEESE